MRQLMLLALAVGCTTKATVTDTGEVVETGDTVTGDETGDTDVASEGEGEGEGEGETGVPAEGEGEGEGEVDPTAHDGSYNGDFSVSVTVYGFGDTCTGSADFVITDGVIDGTVSCAFAPGGVAYTYAGLTDTYDGTLTGAVGTSSDASGEITVELGDGFSTDWTGSFSGATLSANFDGTLTYSGFSLDYDGEFDGSYR